MIGVLMAAAMAAAGVEAPAQEAAFAPLKGPERAYARNGPAGPYYPDRAFRAGRNGEAVTECQVGPRRALDKCSLISESPRDFHFGPAALRMAERRHLLAPEGATEGERMRLRTPFVLRRAGAEEAGDE